MTRCVELCEAIRTNRKIGNSHHNLDRLQSALELATRTIPVEYNTTRRAIGSRIDSGDEKARREMNQHILDIQSRIKPTLREIAYPSRQRQKGEQVVPGFSNLLNHWKLIYQGVSETIDSLSRRIEEATATPTPKPAPLPTPTPTPKKPDEVTISMKRFDHLLEHMKNSWEETIVAGKVLYVNVFDKSNRQWERPESDAFIRSCNRPSKPSRTPSWDNRGW